ncbi:MAG: hypothetical protein DRI72_06700, partial [Bacteroidetes bacterium]
MNMHKIITLTLFTLLATAAFSQTEVEGNQSGTWAATGSPYLVTGELTIPVGASLNIEAGVEIIF